MGSRAFTIILTFSFFFFSSFFSFRKTGMEKIQERGESSEEGSWPAVTSGNHSKFVCVCVCVCVHAHAHMRVCVCAHTLRIIVNDIFVDLAWNWEGLELRTCFYVVWRSVGAVYKFPYIYLFIPRLVQASHSTSHCHMYISMLHLGYISGGTVGSGDIAAGDGRNLPFPVLVPGPPITADHQRRETSLTCVADHQQWETSLTCVADHQRRETSLTCVAKCSVWVMTIWQQ